jgi:hypothetical protein
VKSIAEIVETRIANPVTAVERRVAIVEYVGIILYHELGPAKGAMIVVVASGGLVVAVDE